MIKAYVYLGSSPINEPCAQVGTPDYYHNARIEISAYKEQLIRIHGKPPEGAKYRMSTEQHDLGTYHELVIDITDESSTPACDYALKVEGNLPEVWDNEAKAYIAADKTPHFTA